MSYDMTFQGKLEFKDARTAKKAMVRFRKCIRQDECAVQEEDLALEGVTLSLECFTSAPASMWEDTCAAIAGLTELAKGGQVKAQFDGGEGETSILRLRFLPGDEEEELDGPFPDGLEPTRDAEKSEDDADLDGELGRAALKGDTPEVRSLLSRGAHPEAGLYGAVHHPAVLRLLLENGLVPKGESERQYSPLCTAARGRSAECVRILVEAGALLEEHDTPLRITPLMLAAEGLSVEIVEALIQFGADPNARDRDGNTPLMFAVRFGNDEAVAVAETLAKAGADPEIKNTAGRTFWNKAADTGSADRLEKLRAVFKCSA